MLYLISKNQTKSENEASNSISIADKHTNYKSLHKYQTPHSALKFVPISTDKHQHEIIWKSLPPTHLKA